VSVAACVIRRQQLERDIEMLSQTNKKLHRDLDESEQTRARLELTVSQLRASNRDLAAKLKVEKDEVGRHCSSIDNLHHRAFCGRNVSSCSVLNRSHSEDRS